MKLDRNKNADGRGKYALIRLRLLPERPHNPAHLVQMLTEHPEAVVLGDIGSADEFFPILLKDRYAQNALTAYSDAAWSDGQKEYAEEVNELAKRSGPAHPLCKMPD